LLVLLSTDNSFFYLCRFLHIDGKAINNFRCKRKSKETCNRSLQGFLQSGRYETAFYDKDSIKTRFTLGIIFRTSPWFAGNSNYKL